MGLGTIILTLSFMWYFSTPSLSGVGGGGGGGGCINPLLNLVN